MASSRSGRIELLPDRLVSLAMVSRERQDEAFHLFDDRRPIADLTLDLTSHSHLTACGIPPLRDSAMALRKRCSAATLCVWMIQADAGLDGRRQLYERTGHPHWSGSGAC
jgi:hypothetical protein